LATSGDHILAVDTPGPSVRIEVWLCQFSFPTRGDHGGRWYLRYGSYRDVEELLAECGVTVDHVSVYR
jgi:hypothetical protein